MQTRCFHCRNGSNAKIARSWKFARNICFFGKPENTSGIEVPNNTQSQTTLDPLPDSVTTIAPNIIASTEATSISIYPTTISNATDEDIISSSTTTCLSRGLTNEMCQMTCNRDGTCEEIVNTTECGCNQMEHKSIKKTAFSVGTIMGGKYQYFQDCQSLTHI